MFKWIASIVVLAAVAAGTWWLTQDDSGQGSVEGPGVEQVTGGGTGNPSLEGTNPNEALDPARTQLNGGGPESVNPSVGEGPGTNASASGDITIEVFEAGTGKAIPGADVWFVDRTDLPAAEWQAVWPNGDVKAYVTQKGMQYKAGEDGSVVVPRTQNGGLYASVEGMAGSTAWIGDKNTIRIGLHPSVDLIVQVVDAAGVPQVNVPIGISRNVPGNPAPIITRLTNGVQGAVRFTGLGKTLRSLGPPGYNVHFAFPLPFVERIPFQLEAMPKEPIVMTLPPTGVMSLRVLTEDGEPYNRRGHAMLGIMEPNVLTGDLEFSSYATQEIRGASATFPRVGVNMDLMLRLDGGRALRAYEAPIVGPVQEGEQVHREIVWDTRRPTIRGRAILANGTSLGLMTGGFTIFNNGQQGTSGPQVKTDEIGNFELKFPDHYKAGVDRKIRTYLYPRDGNGPVDAEIDASFEVSLDGTDIGDVVFESRPLLLSGTVRAADSGDLLPRAYVRIELPDKSGAYGPVAGLSIGTDKAGYFELYGRTDAEQFRVVVMRSGFLNATMEPVDYGTTDVNIVMTRGQETSSPLKGNPNALPPRGSGGTDDK
ncbi:MAG: hypothetical protein GY711_19595 [bacterium]|nr:hypothetical protein [bacterium]